jgi:excisionase family DNA binding protein
MDEYADRRNLPGYVSIKEAAKMLGISDKRVYEYVDEGRLPSMWAANVIMIPEEEVKKFQRRSSGRPRKSVPIWRRSEGANTQFKTSIFVKIRPGQQNRWMEKLEEIRQGGKHLFPGTIARFITESETVQGQIEIVLIWRKAVMPKESEREQALSLFRQILEEVLDWNTVSYSYSKVVMHT